MKTLYLSALFACFASQVFAQSGVLRPEYNEKPQNSASSKQKKNYKYKGLTRAERIKLRAKEGMFREPTKEEKFFVHPRNAKGKAQIDTSSSLKLFVWNIQKNVKSNWRKYLAEWEPKSDLLMMQEFNYTPEFKEYLKKARPYYFATAYVYRRKKHLTGVANSALYRPSESKTLDSKRKEPIVDMPKTTLFQWFDLKGKERRLLVVNAHIINFVPTKFFIEQMVDIENVVTKHQGPVIFAGDFNTWAYDLLKYTRSMMARLDLKEVKFSYDRRKRFKGLPLDHVFLRGLSPKKAVTVETKEGSDHNAMYVEAVFD